jgi:hypothetical protein
MWDQKEGLAFATASFNNDFSKSNGTAKASVNGNGIANKNFNNYTELKYETNTTAMANIGYKINSNNKVSFNSLYINTSTQSKEEYTGYIVDIANDGNGLIRRFNYEKNSLWINQILGEHKVGDRSKLNWEFHTILLMEVCQTEFKTFLEMKIQVTNYQASQLLITIDTFKN